MAVRQRLIPIALLSAPATPVLPATKGPTDRWDGALWDRVMSWHKNPTKSAFSFLASQVSSNTLLLGFLLSLSGLLFSMSMKFTKNRNFYIWVNDGFLRSRNQYVESEMGDSSWETLHCSRIYLHAYIYVVVLDSLYYHFWSSIPSDYLLISDRIHKACIPNSGTRASWAQCLYSALLCLFSAICKVARQPTMHGGYHFTGPFHWGNLHLSAAGQITQESITRRSKKVRVIIMSSQVTKVPEIEYCPLESRQRTWKEERRDSYRMRKRYVDRQRRILGNNNILQ